MTDEIMAALIQSVGTLVAAAAGFTAIYFQIGAQGKQSRTAIADTERRRLKAGMYEEALTLARELSDTAGDVSTYCLLIEIALEQSFTQSIHGGRPARPPQRFDQVQAKYQRFSDAAIAVILLIEGRMIIDPRLYVFKLAINSALHDNRQIMYDDLVANVMPALPTDDEFEVWIPPRSWQWTAAQRALQAMSDSVLDVSAYAQDLIVEMQNVLLGDLFEHQVKARQPLDPKKRAITLARSEELTTWLQQTTEYGRRLAKLDELEAGLSRSAGTVGTPIPE